jgi:hypothetical protein
MIRKALAVAITLAGHVRAQPTGKPRPQPAIMPFDTWSALAPSRSAKLDTTPPQDRAEQITVFAHRHHAEAEWRGDFAARTPAYEASGSEAARLAAFLHAYAEYTSPGQARNSPGTAPKQQRLMSVKPDAARAVRCPGRLHSMPQQIALACLGTPGKDWGK